MNKMQSRRDFIRGVLVSSGFFGSIIIPPIINERKRDCTAELEKLFVELQKREIEEKAGLFKALTQRYGPEVLRVVEHFVVEETKKKLERAEVARRDIEGVMENLWNHTKSTHEFQVEERTNESLRLRVTRCLYAEEMRKLHADDIGFAFYCSYDHGFYRGLNPRLRFKRTKTLMMGDDCCDHTYELKEQ